jgi:nucleoside-diphosphate-sugar epimerase
MRYEPAKSAWPLTPGHVSRAVTVAGTGSPLEAAVCHELSASGYRPVPLGTGAPVLVIASEVALPAGWLVSRYRRWRAARRRDDLVAAARLARERGAARLVALSSALLCGLSSSPGPGRPEPGRPQPGDVPPEAAQAIAAEAAAQAFAGLGGTAVVLRLGWTYGDTDRHTRQILAAARRGWLLLDGPPEILVPTIETTDAASAAVAALTAPAGVYYVTDGAARAQRELADAIASAAGRELHPLNDGSLGHGQLFGCSPPADGAEFRVATGWRPRFPDAAERLRQLGQAWPESSGRPRR